MANGKSGRPKAKDPKTHRYNFKLNDEQELHFRKMLEEAGANMKSGRMDTGVTYSNYLYRTTVMVIGRASSDRQFFNSFMHEMRHMEDDLGNMNGIEHDGEEIAYLSGHIAEQVFDYVKLFLCDCDCCKEEIKKRIGYETG